MLRLAQPCTFTLLEERLPQETSAGQRLEKKGVSARVMSQDHSLVGRAALPGLKLLWGCLQRRRVTTIPSSSGKNLFGAENAPAPSDLQIPNESPSVRRPRRSKEGRTSEM